jgi:hypothetical protein
MALTIEDIKSVLFEQAEYWFSRKTNDGYENIPIDEVNDGDIIWFSGTATREDLDDAKKTLKQLDLHMYTKTMDANQKEYTGKPMYTKSGACSFILLPDMDSEKTDITDKKIKRSFRR